MIKLLIVDDSPLMRRLLSHIFNAEPDFTIEIARNGVEGIEKLHDFAPDVITLDVEMPEMDGLTCLDRIMLERPCPVVMLSALTEKGANEALEALALGAVDVIAKPAGAISLAIDDLAPELVARVRSAAGSRISTTRRLRDRIRLRTGGRMETVSPPRSSRAPRLPAKAGARNDLHAEGMKSMDVARRPSTSVGTNGSGLPPATHDGLVLVGSSTGGPPALDALLGPLPADFPWPIVVAQHMPASFTGALARRLDKLCAITVVEVSAPVPLLPGHAYIGRGDADVIIATRAAGPIVMAAPANPDFPWHPSADRLVASAMAHVAPEKLVGVLMTGMGTDGAREMTILQRAGGRTIAESEESAVVWGMPGALVQAGGADMVVPLEEIARALTGLVGR